MATVGLAMMVKNEAHVIERCLQSVRHLVDHWLIVDTGSTDGTQEIARGLLAGVPGTLYERPWVDFGHNRTEVVQAARVTADYTLVIDADDVLETPPGFSWPAFDADLIEVVHRRGSLSSRRAGLLTNAISWHYDGVRDEYLHAPHHVRSVFLPGVLIRQYSDGGRTLGRSVAEVRAEDACALAEALRRYPDHAGYAYHLARAYRDSAQYELALEAFRRRASLEGNPEEVADSLLEIAHHLVHTGADRDTVVGAYLAAWSYRPRRAEALVSLAKFARGQRQFALARMVAAQACSLERPDDMHWVDEDVYAWRRQDEYAISAFWTGHYADSAAASRDLLADGLLPPGQRDRVEANLRHAEAALGTVEAPVTLDVDAHSPVLPGQRTTEATQSPSFDHPVLADQAAAPLVLDAEKPWAPSWSKDTEDVVIGLPGHRVGTDPHGDSRPD